MSLSNSVDFGVIRAVTATGVGAPLAIMSDRQNSGSYPKIANLIDIDHRAFAKLRPGDALILERLSMEEARTERASGPEADAGRKRRTGEEPSSEDLLGRQLVSGVVSAWD